MEGLIHRARLVLSEHGRRRNDQGEYEPEPGPPPTGPWFAARLLSVGTPQKGRRQQESTDARVVAAFELLADPVAEDGSPVEITASSVIETECALLGSPTLEPVQQPEPMNDGEELIGWLVRANVPKDAA